MTLGSEIIFCAYLFHLTVFHLTVFHWVPCEDGKTRRAPNDSFGLVDGLHRSLLGALGNAIVPQVAAQIMQAMKEAGLE